MFILIKHIPINSKTRETDNFEVEVDFFPELYTYIHPRVMFLRSDTCVWMNRLFISYQYTLRVCSELGSYYSVKHLNEQPYQPLFVETQRIAANGLLVVCSVCVFKTLWRSYSVLVL